MLRESSRKSHYITHHNTLCTTSFKMLRVKPLYNTSQHIVYNIMCYYMQVVFEKECHCAHYKIILLL